MRRFVNDSKLCAADRCMRAAALVILAFVVASAGACGHPGGHLPEGSYERGQAEYDGGALLDAIEDLKLFIRRNPQDPLAPDAQFLVGKAYMETEDYPVAAVEFEILQVDYPGSPLADDASYLEAMCYAKQAPDYRLDQTITQQAVTKLRGYLQSHPDGKYLEEARSELTELQGRLDRKRLEAAEFYEGRGYHDSARQVLENVMQDSPDSPLRPEMLLLMGEIEMELEDYDGAERSLRELTDRWPDHRLAKRAQKRLDEITRSRREDDS